MLIENIKTSETSSLNRVPQIILLYWIIKIASTTLGETGADMFSMTFNLGYGLTIALFMGIFLIFLIIKLSMKRYDPLMYWLVFTATAILGTAISDFIDRSLGLGYAFGSIALFSLLLVVLAVWYQHEKSINVEYIKTLPAELYYWLAFLVANTLGTAAGDFLADSLEIGFLNSALIIAGLLIACSILYFYTKVSSLLLFWFAFVLTRPFGATFGDLLTKSPEHGGVGLGTISASAFFGVILIVGLIGEIKAERSKDANKLAF
ncbi:MAG TPA: hypothetical protein ENI24_04905 [Methylophaga sp.]|nr:hypothetical protein [Methylophaga sp.]